MNILAQTDSLRLLRQALQSNSSGVRFGSEFCEHLLPALGMLESAYESTRKASKTFTYVTPRLSDAGIEKLQEHLSFLNQEGEVSIVVNDFGALSILPEYPRLHPHLGRHLFAVPARSPLADRQMQRNESLSEGSLSETERWVRDLYSTTSLNYQPTIAFYRDLGCRKADADWIPYLFPSLGALVAGGLTVSVHLHLVPVTFTRKCHTARFLGEQNPERCHRPCLHRAFVLTNEVLGALELEPYLLHGNAVFRSVQPSREDLAALEGLGVDELVLTMNPLTRIDTTERINDLIVSLGL